MNLVVQENEETLVEFLENQELRQYLGYVDEKETLDNCSEYQESILGGPSKRETCVDYLEIFLFVLLFEFGVIFEVDRLGQTSSGHPSGKNF